MPDLRAQIARAELLASRQTSPQPTTAASSAIAPMAQVARSYSNAAEPTRSH
jgi:hypothetical protein